MRARSRLLSALVAASALLLVGCGGDEPGGTDSADGGAVERAEGRPVASPGSELEGTITVSAAASLTDAFARIVEGFTVANPEVDVTMNFDASSRLASQVIEGAPTDLFASADEANMDRVTDEGLVAGESEVFARNELAVITEPGNPEGITGLADLADVGVVSLCAEEAPCGRYAAEVLAEAGVSIPESDVTRGQNASATLTAVSEGDAVAGIVYASDVVRAGDAVGSLTIPKDRNVVAPYTIGVLAATGEPEVAEAFVAYLSSQEAQAVLEELGFLPAP